jgi:hypothetical protein
MENMPHSGNLAYSQKMRFRASELQSFRASASELQSFRASELQSFRASEPRFDVKGHQFDDNGRLSCHSDWVSQSGSQSVSQ